MQFYLYGPLLASVAIEKPCLAGKLGSGWWRSFVSRSSDQSSGLLRTADGYGGATVAQLRAKDRTGQGRIVGTSSGPFQNLVVIRHPVAPSSGTLRGTLQRSDSWFVNFNALPSFPEPPAQAWCVSTEALLAVTARSGISMEARPYLLAGPVKVSEKLSKTVQ